jgi:hypothetical protein
VRIHAERKSLGSRVAGSFLILGTALMLAASSVAASASAGPIKKEIANCRASFNPYRYSQAQVSACGYKTFPRDTKRAMAGGGSVSTYKMNKMLVKTYTPPAGFRPATASNARLAEYGFPTRPANRKALAVWNREMTRWKGSATAPAFLAETHASADTESNNSWAGYVITAEPGGITSFTHAEGWYVEPSFGSSRCSSTTEVTWAGIGGWNGIPVAQNGTAWNSNGVDAHQAWWEVYPDNSLTTIPFYATAGSLFDASTRYLGNGYRFWFYNYGNNKTDVFDVTNITDYDGLSAEVVVERPIVGKSATNLANFGTLEVDESQANGEYLNTFSPNLNLTLGTWRHGVHMDSNTTGDDLADPSTIGSFGAFTVAQHNCN